MMIGSSLSSNRSIKKIASIVMVILILSLIGGIFLTLCGTRATKAATSWWKPTASAPIHWQWQLGSPFNVSKDIIPNVTVYCIDAFENSAEVVSELHAKGFIVIGYFSFGTYEDWRPDATSFPSSVLGNSNGWPGERWLDIRSDIVKQIMSARFDLAKQKGFDAIEPDNIDGYANDTGFNLTAQDQINYNKWIAEQAHARNLSIGLKNDVEQAAALEPYFDWSLNEEAYKYNEYSFLTIFVNNNKAVFQVEYGSSTPQAEVMNNLHINSMTRDLYLVSPSSTGYVRIPCIPDTQNVWYPASSNPSPSPTAPTGNQPPVLKPIGNKSVEVGTQLRFTISATDPDGDRLTYKAKNLPSGSTFSSSTRTFSWTPKSAGIYTGIRFEVSDGKTTTSETITITVKEPGESAGTPDNPSQQPVGGTTGGGVISIGGIGISPGVSDSIGSPSDTRLLSDDSQAELVLLKGTHISGIDGVITLNHAELGEKELSLLPADKRIIGIPYIISPGNVIFDPPGTLTLSYAKYDVHDSVKTDDFRIYYFDSTQEKWTCLNNSILDTEKGKISVSVSQSGIYAPVGTKFKSTGLEIVNIDIYPPTPNIGDNLSINISFINPGHIPHSELVLLRIDGIIMSTRIITVDPGAIQVVKWWFNGLDAGTHLLEVNNKTAEFIIEKMSQNDLSSDGNMPVVSESKRLSFYPSGLIAVILSSIVIATILSILLIVKFRLLRFIVKTNELETNRSVISNTKNVEQEKH